MMMGQGESPAGQKEAFAWVEGDLANRVGLIKSMMRQFRQELLTPEVHWQKREKRIMWSQAAAELLCDHLGVSRAQIASEKPPGALETPKPQKTRHDSISQAPEPLEPITLKVVRCDWLNPRILTARPVGGARSGSLRVRVKSNSLFHSGQLIRAVRDPKKPVLEYHGAYPKWRGQKVA
jgi:hypothetical protein